MLAFAALLALTLPAPGAAVSDGAGTSMPMVQMPAAGMAARPRNRGIRIRIPDATAGPPLPRIEGSPDPGRPLIVIDPGHGGHDPGAHNARSGWREKDLTLAIARAMRDELVRGGRVRVALTRDDDSFLALAERQDLARAMSATLFISIHADASEDHQARGATVYTLSETATDQEAARLASRENRADILHGVNLSGGSSAVSSILIDLMQRETLAASARFAELLHRESEGLVPFRSPPHRRAALVVLRAPDTPSVLYETGYISNDAEATWLASMDGQRRLARGFARAVTVYMATREARR